MGDAKRPLFRPEGGNLMVGSVVHVALLFGIPTSPARRRFRDRFIFPGQPHQANRGVNIPNAPRWFKNKSDRRYACSACARRRGRRRSSCRRPDRKPHRATTEPQQGRAGRAADNTKGTLGQVSNQAVDTKATSGVIRSEDDSHIQLRFIEGGSTNHHTAGERACDYQTRWCGRGRATFRWCLVAPLKRTGD
jgi:hypothetical protein